jgi:Transglutaminase-like superfamily
MLYLSEHVHFCQSADGAVLLDLHSGGYLGVPASALPCLESQIANWPKTVPSIITRATGQPPLADTAASELIASLHKRGVLTTIATPTRYLACTRPASSISLTGRATESRLPALSYAIPFLLALAEVRTHLRSSKLEPLLLKLGVQLREVALERPQQVPLTKLLSAYWRLRTWTFTAADACLLDSLVLSQFLAKHRIHNTFVIGVTSKPFLAHAWVQIGDAVLNDTAEHVQQFEPILAVGT